VNPVKTKSINVLLSKLFFRPPALSPVISGAVNAGCKRAHIRESGDHGVLLDEMRRKPRKRSP
jgi:hypothetical protein